MSAQGSRDTAYEAEWRSACAAEAEPFTLDEARELIAKVERRAAYHGYLLALYGSVLRDGRGRDLDIVAQPHSIPHDDDGLVRAFEEELPGVITLDEQQPLSATRSVVVQLGGGRYIDLKVRLL